MTVLGECPARCGLTGGCNSCNPTAHPYVTNMPIRMFGWECPRCGVIHSPYTNRCECGDGRATWTLKLGIG